MNRTVRLGAVIFIILCLSLSQNSIGFFLNDFKNSETEISNSRADAITIGHTEYNSGSLDSKNTEVPQLPSSVTSRSISRAWDIDDRIGGMNSADLARDQIYPAVISDNDEYIYCAWQDDRNVDWNIYFSKSSNLADWSTNVRISNTIPSAGHQRYPQIALNPLNSAILYAVWQDERNDDGDIYFSYSLDRGDTWTNETLVNTDTAKDSSQWYPVVAADQLGNIFVAWMDNYKLTAGPDVTGDWNIRLSRSSDQGKTWTTPIVVNDLFPSDKDQTMPKIAIDSFGIIYVVWEDDRADDKQIFFCRSTDHGASFSSDIRISRIKAFSAANEPEIKLDDYENIFIVWLEDDNSRYNVFFTKSFDNGKTFETPIVVNDVANICHADADPAIVIDKKANIYVAWTDQRAENHIYIGQSIDNGKSFTFSEKVDDADNSSATGISVTTQEQLFRGQAELVLMKTKVFTFWMDYLNDPNPDDGTPKNGDIYFDSNFTNPNRAPEKLNFNTGPVEKSWNYINISWPISPDLDFAYYNLYLSIIPDFKPNTSTLNSTIYERYRNYLNVSGLAHGTTYYFHLRVTDNLGLSNMSDKHIEFTKLNIPPNIEIYEPDGDQDLVDSTFEITWWDNDPDDNATITLYYDNNPNPNDGKVLITEVPIREDEPMDSYTWDTSNITNGTYFILAIISDGVNSEKIVYSPGQVIIYHGNQDPWLIISFMSPKNITDVGLSEPIVTIFNKELDMNSINQNTFIVSDAMGYKVNGTFEYFESTNRLLFYPEVPWNGSERYHINLTSDIMDKSQIFNLMQEYSWWFETEQVIIKNGTIQGEVREEYLKNPIQGAVVNLYEPIENITWKTTTDSSGLFSFYVGYGVYELSIETNDFQPPVPIIIHLDQNIFDLEPIELIQPFITKFEIDSKITAEKEFKVTAGALHPRNESLTYTWDFGDDTEKTGQSTSHTYKEPGTYEIKLTVSDENGGIAIKTETVNIEKAEGDLLGFYLILAVIILIIGLLILFFLIYTARKRQMKKLESLESRMEQEEEEELEEEELEDEELEDEELGEEELGEEELEEEELEEEELEDEELEEEEPEDEELEDEEPEDEAKQEEKPVKSITVKKTKKEMKHKVSLAKKKIRTDKTKPKTKPRPKPKLKSKSRPKTKTKSK